MSIIEHALEKGRAAQRSRRASDAVELSQRAVAIDSTARIVPLAVTVDSALCRERRLLLNGNAETDGGAVAAYRMLRTRLLQRARTNNWKTIAVTSAGPNDGKTLTAINLALSMAREKSRETILLDMDMRNPSVCRTLGVHPPHELRDYLERGEHAQQLFFSVCSDNLMIASNTRPAEHASELLASPRFEQLVGLVQKGTVDPVILIDLPPVLLTDDALVVAPKVDATLLVVSEGVTGRANFEKALNILSEFKVAGVVFNRAADVVPGYSYEYYSDEAKGASEQVI